MYFPDLQIRVTKMLLGVLSPTKFGGLCIKPLKGLPVETVLDAKFWAKSKEGLYVVRPYGTDPSTEEPLYPGKIRWYWKVALLHSRDPTNIILKVYERANLKHLNFVEQPFEIRYIDKNTLQWAGVQHLYEPAYQSFFELVPPKMYQ